MTDMIQGIVILVDPAYLSQMLVRMKSRQELPLETNPNAGTSSHVQGYRTGKKPHPPRNLP